MKKLGDGTKESNYLNSLRERINKQSPYVDKFKTRLSVYTKDGGQFQQEIMQPNNDIFETMEQRVIKENIFEDKPTISTNKFQGREDETEPTSPSIVYKKRRKSIRRPSVENENYMAPKSTSVPIINDLHEELKGASLNPYQLDKVKTYVNKLKESQAIQLSNMRSLAAKKATDWITNNTGVVCRNFEQEIRNIVMQFSDFRERVMARQRINEAYEDIISYQEKAICEHDTILDAEYGIKNAFVPLDNIANKLLEKQQLQKLQMYQADKFELDLEKHQANFNPLRLYDNLKLKQIVVGQGEEQSEVVTKYQKILDVYKEQNQILRIRLEAVETELKSKIFVEEIFKTRVADSIITQELCEVKQALCKCQDQLAYVTKDFEATISQLEFDLQNMRDDVEGAVAEVLKPLLTELSLREKIQQNLQCKNDEYESINSAMKAVLKTPYLLSQFKNAVSRRKNNEQMTTSSPRPQQLMSPLIQKKILFEQSTTPAQKAADQVSKTKKEDVQQIFDSITNMVFTQNKRLKTAKVRRSAPQSFSQIMKDQTKNIGKYLKTQKNEKDFLDYQNEYVDFCGCGKKEHEKPPKPNYYSAKFLQNRISGMRISQPTVSTKIITNSTVRSSTPSTKSGTNKISRNIKSPDLDRGFQILMSTIPSQY